MLSEAFKDSDPATPIYFILSAGANVTADVDKLADKHNMERGATYHDISLGQVNLDIQFQCFDAVGATGMQMLLAWQVYLQVFSPSAQLRFWFGKESGFLPRQRWP